VHNTHPQTNTAFLQPVGARLRGCKNVKFALCILHFALGSRPKPGRHILFMCLTGGLCNILLILSL